VCLGYNVRWLREDAAAPFLAHQEAPTVVARQGDPPISIGLDKSRVRHTDADWGQSRCSDICRPVVEECEGRENAASRLCQLSSAMRTLAKGLLTVQGCKDCK
jgi:hypothetical protein